MIYWVFAFIATGLAYLSVHVKGRKLKVIEGQTIVYPDKILFGLSFLVYFIPAAVRYGIGQDYFYTYAPTFRWIANGDINLETHSLIRYNEWGFTVLNKAIAFFTSDYQWLFVITALISLVLVYKSIKKDSVSIPFSVLMLVLGSYYLASYNFIRQCIAIAIFAYSLKYVEERKSVQYFICAALATTMHTISIIYFPFYFLGNVKLKKKLYYILPIAIIGGLAVSSPIVIRIISLTRFSRNISLGQHYNLFLSAVVLLVYYATIVGFDEKDTRYRMYANALLIAACCIDSSDLGDAHLEEMKNALLDKKPTIVFSYSSTLVELAKYIDRSGIPKEGFSMKSVLTGGEGLSDENRNLLEKVFGSTVYRRYSDMELGILGQDMGNGSEYILNWGSYYFETLKLDSDKPTEMGEAGRIVITDLFNYAFPMIRYDTGDLGVLDKSNPNELPKLKEIYGRVRDCVYATDGRLISPAKVSVMMWGSDGVKQWQFIQKTKDNYILKLNCEKKVDTETYVKKFKGLLGESADIEVQLVDEIPVTSSNKRRAVICNYHKE